MELNRTMTWLLFFSGGKETIFLNAINFNTAYSPAKPIYAASNNIIQLVAHSSSILSNYIKDVHILRASRCLLLHKQYKNYYHNKRLTTIIKKYSLRETL